MVLSPLLVRLQAEANQGYACFAASERFDDRSGYPCVRTCFPSPLRWNNLTKECQWSHYLGGFMAPFGRFGIC